MTYKKYIILILLIYICTRFVWGVFYHKLIYKDTASYRDMATWLMKLDFSQDQTGMRTPGYPLFLAVCFILSGTDNYDAVATTQMVLGVVAALMVFYIFRMVTKDDKKSFLAALVYILNPCHVLFELSILTEFFTLLLLLVNTWLLLLIFNDYSWNKTLVLGILAAYLTLVRPQYVAFPLLCLGILLLKSKSKRKQVLVFILVPYMVLTGGWIYRNYSRFNYPGITTLLPITLSQHTGVIMEKARPQYRDLAEIYIKYREIQRKKINTHLGTMWRAYPEMMEKRGVSYPQLAKPLTSMSLGIVVDYPLLHFKSMMKALRSSFLPALYLDVKESWFFFTPWFTAFKILHFFMFITCAIVLVSALFNKNYELVILYAIIFYAFGSSIPVDMGNNARNVIPIIPLVYGITTVTIHGYLGGKKKSPFKPLKTPAWFVNLSN